MVRDKSKTSASEVLDRLFEQVSPEVLLAGMLGGIATAGGVTPPLTRMLVAISGDDGPSKDIKEHFNKVSKSAYWNVVQLGSPAAFIGSFLMGSSGEGSNARIVPIEQYALVAAGIMEGMMVMSFMQNKEAQTVLVNAASAVADALPL